MQFRPVLFAPRDSLLHIYRTPFSLLCTFTITNSCFKALLLPTDVKTVRFYREISHWLESGTDFKRYRKNTTFSWDIIILWSRSRQLDNWRPVDNLNDFAIHNYNKLFSMCLSMCWSMCLSNYLCFYVTSFLQR